MVKKLSKTALPLALITLIGMQAANAEDGAQGSSKPFFPQNYVNSEQNGRQPQFPAQAGKSGGKGAANHKRGKEMPVAPDATNSDQHRGENESTTGKQIELGSELVEIETIGAILSSKDPQHLKDMLQELLDTAIKYDFALGDIITVGFPPDSQDLKPLMIKLAAREGNLRALGAVPEKYQVSKSPTWIIATSAGEILLEGTGSLGENFNSQGKFLNKFQKLDEGQ